ncbi:MAG: hypothetical protein ACRD3C_09660 [Vicinamibacterales bacterium]
MKLIFTCLCLIVLLTACNDSQGALTTPSSVEGPSQRPALTHRLSGVVTTAGVPVSGVAVAEIETNASDECFTPVELSGTTSDATGSYTLPAVRDASSSPWPSWLRAHKPGYFTNFQRPWVSKDMSLDFRLDPWVPISLGQVVRRTVDVGDAFCYGNSYGVPGHCHRFALTVRSPGTLEVTLTWPNSRPDVVLDVVRPGGLPCAKFSWPGGSRHELAMPADAGSTYEIRVVDDGSASPLNYELTTVLR